MISSSLIRILQSVVGLVLILSAAPGIAADKPRVRWLVLDFPPYHIVQGADEGSGVFDKFQTRLQEELPAFTHLAERSSISRIDALMKDGAPVCAVSRIKTPEREVFGVFSKKPYLLLLPVRLVSALEDDQGNRLPTSDQVSLVALLRSENFHLGLVESRRYGVPVDDILAKAPAERLVHFKTDSLLLTSLTMMDRGRFNATLGYSAEIEYLRQAEKLTGQVRYLPLVETSQLFPVYVACARTALGQKVIDAVDRLPDNRPILKEIIADYERYLPADELRRYRAMRARRSD